MKAWIVEYDQQWITLTHAETEGKAKAWACRYFSDSDFNDFVNYRARRLPGCDDKPLTYDNCKDAGFWYLEEDGSPMKKGDFINDCQCDLCKPLGLGVYA